MKQCQGAKPGGRLDGSHVRSLYSPLHDRNRRSVFKQAVIVLSLNSPILRRHATRGRHGRPARRVERSLLGEQVGSDKPVAWAASSRHRASHRLPVLHAESSGAAPPCECWVPKKLEPTQCVRMCTHVSTCTPSGG